MLDLKPYYDAVVAADAELKRVANDIDTLFRGETDEATEQALALRPALDEAQKKYDQTLGLYEALKKANQPGDLKDFVPVSDTSPTPEGETPKGVMKRQEFEALLPLERAAFVKGGGKIQD